jgi:hypothetical protein
VNKLERRFYLVDAQVLPEVFLKVIRAKELLASGQEHFGRHTGGGAVPQRLLQIQGLHL